MEYIFIGDPHVKITNINDCQLIFDKIEKTAIDRDIRKIFIFGDLFNNHSVKRIEVEKFWVDTFLKLTKHSQVYAIVGNHDMTSEYNQINNAMCGLFIDGLRIIDSPAQVDSESIGMMPYYRTEQEFLENLKTVSSCKTILCHQTLINSQYSGWGTKEDVNSENLPHKFISGHIHTGGVFKNIQYLGSLKWDDLSDANLDKGFYLYNSESEELEFIGVSDVVKPIRKIKIAEFDDKFPKLSDDSINYLEVVGSDEFIAKMKKKYGNVAKIKPMPVNKKNFDLTQTRVQDLKSHILTNTLNGQDLINYIGKFQI